MKAIMVAILFAGVLACGAGCDSGDGSSCSEGDCVPPEYMCGAAAFYCDLRENPAAVCCYYGEDFQSGCDCGLCISYETAAEAESVMANMEAILQSNQ